MPFFMSLPIPLRIHSPPLAVQPGGALATRSSPPLQPGQQLAVQVEARLSTQTVLLRVLASGQLLSARTPLDLLPGEQLQVQVTPGLPGDGRIRLQILPPPGQGRGEAAVRQAAILQCLPRQEPVQSLTRLLGESRQWPEPVQAAIRAFMAVIPERADLTTAGQLRQAVFDSGLFLEARLAAGADPREIGQDIKAQMLHLAAAVQTLTHTEESPGLARQVEAALARVVMDQLASLPDPEAVRQVLQLSLPFQDQGHQDAVELVLTRESRRSPAGEPEEWVVELALHPPGLGVFSARLVWRQGRLDTWLWSDTPATTAHIDHHLGALEARYRQAGIESGSVSALLPAAGRKIRKIMPDTGESLVDIQI